MPAAITVDDVSKAFKVFHERNQSLKAVVMRRNRIRFDQFWALHNVSFEVPHGSTFGIVGSNGSGKSTTLKILARILEPDGGKVTLDGRVSALLELGSGFHPDLSGRENIFLNGAILGIGKKQLAARLDDIVGFAGLEKFIDNPVKTYSSGMYARLGFSVAINVDPDILLIDEVLAVGDESFQRKCAEKIEDLRASGRTVVIVTHAMGQVRYLCDHAAWIDKGTLRALGPVDDVVNAYVADIHTDTVVDDQGRARFGSGEVRLEKVELISGPQGVGAMAATGEPVTFRLHIEGSGSIPHPVLSLEIWRTDGVHVTTLSTLRTFDIAELAGGSIVDLDVPALAMLPATYEMRVTIADESGQHVVDRLNDAGRFDVVTHHSGVADGLLWMPVGWSSRASGDG